MDSQRQTQFELFPGQPRTDAPSQDRSEFFLKRFTFSLENIVLLGIMMMIGMVISFSLGVERGKGMGRAFQRVVEKRVEHSAMAIAAEVAPAQFELKPPVASAVKPAAISQPAPTEPSAPAAPVEKMLDKSNESFYTVQVASYKKEDQAKDAAMKLQKKGYESLVLSKGSYSIVCVGRFSKKNEAKDLARKLKKDYKDCLVRKI